MQHLIALVTCKSPSAAAAALQVMSHKDEGTQQPAGDSYLRNYHLIRLLWLVTPKTNLPQGR